MAGRRASISEAARLLSPPPPPPVVVKPPEARAKLAPCISLHRPVLPWCGACLVLLFAGMSVADKLSIFTGSRGSLLFLLSLPLLYTIYVLDETFSRLETERRVATDRLEKCDIRCEELVRELNQALAAQKDVRDARNSFLVQTIERIGQFGNTLRGTPNIPPAPPIPFRLLVTRSTSVIRFFLILGRWNMLGELKLPKEQENYARDVKESLHSLASFISDSLLLVRADARQVKLERGPFNLETFMETVIDNAAPLIEDRDIDLLYWITSDVPLQLIGDTNLLSKLLNTIVMTAIQDTHKGEVVVLVKQNSLTTSNFRLTFNVIATGLTFTNDELSAMAAPYPSMSQKNLGVSICNRLAVLLDGSITITSDKNKGSSFMLELPVSINRNCPFVERMAIENVYDLSVCVVDDHAYSTDITSRMLRQLGARVESSPDWVSGLNRIKDSFFDVALVDHTLPDIDCVDYCQLIKQQSKNPNICIMIAAFASYKPKLLQAASVITSVVVKPVKRAALITALGQASDMRRAATLADPSQRRDSMPTPAAQLNVLVAEVQDNALSQRVLRSLVERAGHLCKVVDDGQQAVQAYLRDPNVDVILMDCRMPVMDGWVATKVIRAHEAESKSKRVYIVALTADDGGQEAASRAGMDDYLVKPVNKGALLKVFHQLLERKLVAPQKQKSDKQASILLAEDNPVAANVASVVLRQHYHVDVAPHARMAIEMVKANRAAYDLILMDADLPLIDNRTCVELVREYESELSKHPEPIIALAAGNSNSLATYLDAGFNDVVKKPVDYPDLLSRVHKILQRRMDAK